MEKSIPIEDLKELAQKLFKTQNTWDIVKNGAVVAGYDSLTKIEKAVALKKFFQVYTEDQIAYIRLTEDLTSGFAFTVDSFCAGGNIKNALIKYTYIKSAVAYEDADEQEDGTCNSRCYGIKINGSASLSDAVKVIGDHTYESSDVVNRDELSAREEDDLFGTDLKVYNATAKFLNFVKEL